MNAINTRVIPVSAYAMNVCMLPRGELQELNMVIKRKLREWKVHGKQASDKRLYLPRSEGGRGLKSLEDVYATTKIRIASYLSQSEDQWLKVVRDRDMKK